LVAFVKVEYAVKHPTLDPRLFKVRGFSTGAAAVTIVFFNMFTMFFLVTQYLQFVKGYSPLKGGLAVLPNAFALMAVAPQGPKVVARIGVRATVRAGFLLGGLGFLAMALATRSTPYPLFALALVCTGSGIALVMPPSSQLIVGSLPLSKAGVGSAVNDVTREVGGALGIAVAGSIAYSVYRGAIDLPAQMPGPAREIASESVGAANAVAQRALDSGLIDAAQYHEVFVRAGDAFTKGTRAAFLVTTAVAWICAALLPRQMPDELPSREVGAAAPPAVDPAVDAVS
jgi:predicted MFS family arabinose efflux permease